MAEEGQAQARKKAKGAKRSLARAQGRVALPEAMPLAPSSTRAPTLDEDEVAEFEQRNGELTAQVKALRQEAKDNGAEYARNKGAVANMGVGRGGPRRHAGRAPHALRPAEKAAARARNLEAQLAEMKAVGSALAKAKDDAEVKADKGPEIKVPL